MDSQFPTDTLPFITQSKLAMKSMDVHGFFSCWWSKRLPHTFIHENPPSLQSSWTDLSMKKCSWKFIDFHVNQSLATPDDN